MFQKTDALTGRLSDSLRQGLRELYGHYEVEIISCVFWRNRAPWVLERRQCFDSFLLFPLRGRLRVTLSGDVMRVSPGEYLALSDGEAHAIVLDKGHPRLEQISLHCRIQDRWGRPLLARFRRPVAALTDAARWHRVLADLAALTHADPATGREQGRALVPELMADRLRAGERLLPLPRGGDARIERILRRMDEELASPLLSIDALARDVGLTGTQVRKLFRRETRLRPKYYLQRLRLKKAVRLLRHSTQAVKEIAFACGFATDNYFHTVFREAFGTTPAEFREKEAL
jgi:AraC-like DNA-binding protein